MKSSMLENTQSGRNIWMVNNGRIVIIRVVLFYYISGKHM